jgi:hypothetical protein
MRSVRGIRGVVAIGAAAVLAAVVGAGCRRHEASSQELPDRAQPVATVVDSQLLPGDRRLPGGASPVTTVAPRPIGRPSSPVPAHRTPVTRPPLVLPGVETTTTTTL